MQIKDNHLCTNANVFFSFSRNKTDEIMKNMHIFILKKKCIFCFGSQTKTSFCRLKMESKRKCTKSGQSQVNRIFRHVFLSREFPFECITLHAVISIWSDFLGCIQVKNSQNFLNSFKFKRKTRQKNTIFPSINLGSFLFKNYDLKVFAF